MTINLADRYALLKTEIDRLTADLDVCKAEIRALGRERIEGTSVIVTLSLSERASLDTVAVKRLLTPEQISACTRTTQIETIRIKPRVVVAA